MRTLDEVIKALECCLDYGKCLTDCPYHDECADDEKADALHYLKQFQRIVKILAPIVRKYEDAG